MLCASVYVSSCISTTMYYKNMLRRAREKPVCERAQKAWGYNDTRVRSFAKGAKGKTQRASGRCKINAKGRRVRSREEAYRLERCA